MIVWNLSDKLRWFHWSSKPHTLVILGGIDERMFSRSKKTHVCSTLMAFGRLGLILESSFLSGSSTRKHDQGPEGPRNSIMWERGEGVADLLLEEEKSREQERHRSLNRWQYYLGKGLDLIYVAPEYGAKNQWLEVLGRKNPASIEGGTSTND